MAIQKGKNIPSNSLLFVKQSKLEYLLLIKHSIIIVIFVI